jgi:hypothetical protein
VFSEFLDFFRKNYYNENHLALFHVLPFQYDEIQCLYLKAISVNNLVNNTSQSQYDNYELGEFYENSDTELDFLKLFAHVSKFGFKRIGETNLFYNSTYHQEVVND